MNGSERLRQISFDTLELVISEGYTTEVENSNNLRVLNDKPSDPAIIYFNHLAKDEPLLTSLMIKQYADKRLDNLVMPVSYWHSQFENYRAYYAAVQYGEKIGKLKLPRVVQTYDLRGQDNRQEGGESLEKISRGLNRELKMVLDQSIPEGALLVISPEGHRSDNGRLLPATGGLGFAVNMMHKFRGQGKIENGYVIPIGIVFEDYKGPQFHYRSGRRPLAKSRVKMIVGKPLETSEVIERTKDFTEFLLDESKSDASSISHYLLWKLSGLLPEEMEGVYASDKIKETFSGNYELRIKGNRKVREVGIYDKGNEIFIEDGKPGA